MPPRSWEQEPSVSNVQVFGERLHATLAEAPGDEARRAGDSIAAELAAAGIRVESARVTAPSLEDIFIARIREREAETSREVAR